MSSVKFTEELRMRHADQENKRIGDVYAECERRGCTRSFITAFNTRIELFPMRQTLAFLERKDSFSKELKQWKIYLQVLVDLRPDHEKYDEWKQAIKEMEK